MKERLWKGSLGKQIICFVLTLLMVVTLVPFNQMAVFARDAGSSGEECETIQVSDVTAGESSHFTIGNMDVNSGNIQLSATKGSTITSKNGEIITKIVVHFNESRLLYNGETTISPGYQNQIMNSVTVNKCSGSNGAFNDIYANSITLSTISPSYTAMATSIDVYYVVADAAENYVTVLNKINSIDGAADTADFEQKINEARTAYDALSEEQKAKITESQVSTLTNAEQDLKDIKAGCMEMADVSSSDFKIYKNSEDGDVEFTGPGDTYSGGCRLLGTERQFVVSMSDINKEIDKIVVGICGGNARYTFEVIRPTTTEYSVSGNEVTITNIRKMSDTQSTYCIFSYDTPQTYKIYSVKVYYTDYTDINAAVEKMNAIGTVAFTDDCKEKIDAARNAYDALPDSQKEKISEEQYKILTDAEEQYNSLKAEVDDAKTTYKDAAYEDVKCIAGYVWDITNIAGKEKNAVELDIVNDDELAALLGDEVDTTNGVNVWLEATDVTDTLGIFDRAVIESKANDYTVGSYLDLSLFEKVDNKDAEQIYTLNGKMKVSVVIPEELRKDGRSYEILRFHDDEATILDGTYDEATHAFTFETDKFSTYAIAYKDKEDDSTVITPTGDTTTSTGGTTTVTSDNGTTSTGGTTSVTSAAGTTSTSNTTATTSDTTAAPKTGDTSEPVVWALMLAVSLAGVLVVRKKRIVR